MVLQRVLLLRLDVAAQERNRVELVAADPARQDFLLARDVEPPFAALADQRHRHRPVAVADDQHGALRVVHVVGDGHLLARLLGELRDVVLVPDRVARGDDVLAVGAEDLEQGGHVVGLRPP